MSLFINLQKYLSRRSKQPVYEEGRYRYGRNQKRIVQLSAWNIPSFAFLSAKGSNDYAHPDAVSFYRTVLGMTTEQFFYQNLWWIFAKLNRDYYILFAAADFKHRSEPILTTETLSSLWNTMLVLAKSCKYSPVFS